MTFNKEGIIKFTCDWNNRKIDLSTFDLEEINRQRSELISIGLVGSDKQGIGFGNISLRIPGTGEFIITGSQTGHLPQLKEKHFARVNGFSVEENSVHCIGETKASSESLSHAIFYDFSNEINAVVHIHNNELWEKLLPLYPKTDESAGYGTADLAKSLKELLTRIHPLGEKVIVMAGHADGLIFYGKNLTEVVDVIVELL
jgi:L-ribulose-5-phosphate 4-epimerase